MKLEDYLQTYQWFSGKTSDILRHLSLAGIAIIWIFRVSGDSGIRISEELARPLILFIASLGFDLFQYVSGSIVWGGLFRYYEKNKLSDKDNLKHSDWFTVPIYIFFCGKLLLTIVAYVFIIKYLSGILD